MDIDDEKHPYRKQSPITREYDETGKLIDALNPESKLKYLVMLRGVPHYGGWYDKGKRDSNVRGKDQVENFLEKLNLRTNLFESKQDELTKISDGLQKLVHKSELNILIYEKN